MDATKEGGQVGKDSGTPIFTSPIPLFSCDHHVKRYGEK